jgi:hypothetical protein
MLLCELDGYAPAGGKVRGKPTLNLTDTMDGALENVWTLSE